MRQQSSLPQPKSSGFLSLGSPVTVRFTMFAGFAQVLVGAAAFTSSCVRDVLLVVLMAICSPTHVLNPSTPSRAARGLLD